MKTFKLSVASLLWVGLAAAQQTITMRIDNQKDAWGESVVYVGEVKNGKPNGLGLHIYSNGTALRYAGYFVDGLPQGKGALILNDGAFLWGTWVKGKLNGTGANLMSSGNLYIGQFANGMKDGKGTLVYSNNGFDVGNYKSDQRGGRVINVTDDGTILSDNIYQNDSKNGPGYQYEVLQKKLFKGTWADGKWGGASEPYYNSFLTDKRFTAENTDKQILMGCVNSERNVQDTAFYRNKLKATRYFGVYNKGKLVDGIIIREDSTVFIGKRNDSGALGNASFLKRGKFYDEGMYVNDYLNGPGSLSIDLGKKSIYYGSIIGKGEFSGKAWFANNKNVLYNGNYVKGKFTGNGSRLDSNGYRVTGNWNDGQLLQLTSLTGPDGKAISMTPASLADGLTQLIRLYALDFQYIEGEETFDDLMSDADYAVKSFYKPLPAAKDNYIMNYGEGTTHISVLYDLEDVNAASVKYAALCKQISTITLPLSKVGTLQKLTTKDPLKPAELGKSITRFTLSPASSKWGLVSVMVIMVLDKETDQYKVLLAVGDDFAVEDWMDNY